ncbi:putative flippase GtrA [Nitrospirillum bahiense]|uniref:Putative flippase GtrA n=2 Tax=Nitrospirillum amazonense TaxID=28077 RepID=A0A560FXL3_9PROT|nr:putative flippase GtrA [Nitrospirillum amazonense]
MRRQSTTSLDLPPWLRKHLPARLGLALGNENGERLGDFIRFVLVGVLNTLFGYGVFAAGILTTGDHRLALTAANVIGVAFNFLTTGRLVFGSQRIHRLPLFIGGYIVCFIVNLEALELTHAAGVPSLLAQVLLLPIMVILSFIINKFIVFGRGN